ncbi:serine hydrolase [Winogradskyella sp. PG-2]|uniref:serine hydrolase n=1 Tax=Winogradskyella sp. PG-2 TaxID=754409 RepID=UPI0004585CF5|nr:serine hydrolase [Winogradskyella sp. PG-2]BAO76721.1 D-alanyl-D-alanine carboxypeptidase [Winogradskyella sp. PG-2]
MKTNYSIALFLLSFVFTITISAQNDTQQFDDIVSQFYNNSDAPGATVLVAKNGKTIYRKAVGKSSIELDVDMIPENVFMLASITKQFTAVSILMLKEQGKLSLDDPITKFIPDYPTLGKTITVHHLLNHTSGIRSYTGIGNLVEVARNDKTLDELIDYFKNEPMDFDPGEEFRYNNSGYVLLGKIIEVISGDTYENFIENKIFKQLGMASSSYGNTRELVKNRVEGYEQDDSGYVNANYLSMTLPHAAGSLTSTIDDMLKWQNALTNNTFIKASTLEKAINGSELNNGEHIGYGYGLGEMSLRKSKGYTHSGGIFGTSTNGIYLIEEDVYVIGLSNCSCNDIGGLTQNLAAAAIGKPFPTMKDVVKISDDKLKQWVGAYEFEDGAIRHIFMKDGKLSSMRESETNTVFEIFPLSENHFMFEEGNIEYKFSKTDDGKHQAIFITDSENIGKEVNKAMPAARKEITLSNDILKHYVGKYELAPNFNVEVTVEGNQIYGQATGQGKFEVFAENENTFFAKVTELKVKFNKNAAGNVESFTLYQGGQETIAKKIE